MALVGGQDVVPRGGTTEAWLAWGYLVTFGSVVAFTAYVWLLDKAPISLVATYAYVNPIVAVFLGWIILSEPVTPAILIGGAVAVAGVALVVASERRPRHGSRPAHEQSQSAAHEPPPPAADEHPQSAAARSATAQPSDA